MFWYQNEAGRNEVDVAKTVDPLIESMYYQSQASTRTTNLFKKVFCLLLDKLEIERKENRDWVSYRDPGTKIRRQRPSTESIGRSLVAVGLHYTWLLYRLDVLWKLLWGGFRLDVGMGVGTSVAAVQGVCSAADVRP